MQILMSYFLMSCFWQAFAREANEVFFEPISNNWPAISRLCLCLILNLIQIPDLESSFRLGASGRLKSTCKLCCDMNRGNNLYLRSRFPRTDYFISGLSGTQKYINEQTVV